LRLQHVWGGRTAIRHGIDDNARRVGIAFSYGTLFVDAAGSFVMGVASIALSVGAVLTGLAFARAAVRFHRSLRRHDLSKGVYQSYHPATVD
jgi:hypothetical protein